MKKKIGDLTLLSALVQIDIDQYPLPTRESILHTIRHGKLFSKIDLKDVYLQMELDEEAKDILVVITPLGLFQYQRLPYGIASEPALFQKYLEQLIQGIDGCANFLDDGIISGATSEEHSKRLEQILSLLQQSNKTKCEFFREKLTYLDRQISATGILPDDRGVKAIEDMPCPRDLKEVESLLGKINYYHNFIPNFSQLAATTSEKC